MKARVEFKPTQTWIKEHKYRPPECGDSDCYCVLDHFNELSYGFCTGIKLNNEGDLDVVSFCSVMYSEDSDDVRRYLWHPNEALAIAAFLNMTVVNVLGLMPEFRKQLGIMNRIRTRAVRKRDKANEDK